MKRTRSHAPAPGRGAAADFESPAEVSEIRTSSRPAAAAGPARRVQRRSEPEGGSGGGVKNRPTDWNRDFFIIGLWSL